MATIPSQLSSLRPGLEVCGFRDFPDDLRDRLIATLHFYYEHLARVAAGNRSRMTFIGNDELKDELKAGIARAFDDIGVPMSTAFAEQLDNAATASRNFESGHRYSLEEYTRS